MPGWTRASLRSGSIARTLVQVLGPVDHDGDVAAAAGQAGAAAAREERRAMSPADRDRLDHIVDVPRDHDADRHLAVVRAVGGVQGAAAGVESDLAADRLAQLGRDRPGVDEERPLDLLAVSLAAGRRGRGCDRHRHRPFFDDCRHLRRR